MKIRFLAISALLVISGIPHVASAKGCLKGAAVGGVGGHVAGGHGVLGAAAGCAVGRHMANKKETEKGAQTAPASVPAPAQ